VPDKFWFKVVACKAIHAYDYGLPTYILVLRCFIGHVFGQRFAKNLKVTEPCIRSPCLKVSLIFIIIVGFDFERIKSVPYVMSMAF
jgi:hypothetical protein